MRILVGHRVLAPSWLMTLVTLALCTAFLALGRWQWERGNARERAYEEFARGTERAVPLGSRGLDEVPRFQRIRVTGRFDARRQFLLDNRPHGERTGYEVLTPLERDDGRVLLVDRGWVPFTGYRERLPDVAFEPGAVTEVIGRVDELPSAGLASGRAPPDMASSWPKLTSYPRAAELRAALGRRVESRIVLLDAGAANGYVRDWRLPGLTPLRHWSYAIQWWSFAVLAIVLWAIMSLRRGRTVS